MPSSENNWESCVANNVWQLIYGIINVTLPEPAKTSLLYCIHLFHDGNILMKTKVSGFSGEVESSQEALFQQWVWRYWVWKLKHRLQFAISFTFGSTLIF